MTSGESIEEITLEIDAGKEPAIIFVNEGFHRGWHAFHDGDEIPIHRARMTFKAIPVSEGQPTIRLATTCRAARAVRECA